MKKLLLLVFFSCVLFSVKAQSSLGVPDTLAYLKTIISNKGHYIGQPFSRLQDSLRLELNYFHPHSGKHWDIRQETSTHFAFLFPQNENQMYRIYPGLEIYWQIPLNATSSRAIWSATTTTGWNSAAENFYSGAIIKDIVLVEYQ